MKLAYVYFYGFRGFLEPIRIEFSRSFTVIDGRNGVGKSTIFDAIEFALTGTISKCLDAKSGRESVADYLWWTGQSKAASDNFVEVGFHDGEKITSIRRTPTNSAQDSIENIADRLIDSDMAPRSAIAQLCNSTIIRDEHIARLSLDMKETDRFSLLRDAVGAIDAETWINRAKALGSTASARVKSTEENLKQGKQRFSAALRKIDEARAALPATSLVSETARRLQARLDSSAAPDQLPDVARRRIAEIAAEIEALRAFSEDFKQIGLIKAKLPELEQRAKVAGRKLEECSQAVDDLTAAIMESIQSTAISKQAQQIEELVNLGRALDLRNGRCPLCESEISHFDFNNGLENGMALARELDAQAVEKAEQERALESAKANHRASEEDFRAARDERDQAKKQIQTFAERLASHSLSETTSEQIAGLLEKRESERKAISSELRLIDTISLDRAIVQAEADKENAESQISSIEAVLGRDRLAATRAKAIFDASRRAAAETLDERLDRILPLMSELYRRLRPHPIWNDIEYSVRGDVQRFLKLQVGGNVNPQFVFSSGQRRATGLAFLLSVNLSITWSRWRSILLDDPVQHIDDFRAVHLAEVLSNICQSGRQIVCAVEDRALADLMCRRLPAIEHQPGKRITLGTDENGVLAIIKETNVASLIPRALVIPDQLQRA